MFSRIWSAIKSFVAPAPQPPLVNDPVVPAVVAPSPVVEAPPAPVATTDPVPADAVAGTVKQAEAVVTPINTDATVKPKTRKKVAGDKKSATKPKNSKAKPAAKPKKTK